MGYPSSDKTHGNAGYFWGDLTEPNLRGIGSLARQLEGLAAFALGIVVIAVVVAL
jgi:hypothetical protein